MMILIATGVSRQEASAGPDTRHHGMKRSSCDTPCTLLQPRHKGIVKRHSSAKNLPVYIIVAFPPLLSFFSKKYKEGRTDMELKLYSRTSYRPRKKVKAGEHQGKQPHASSLPPFENGSDWTNDGIHHHFRTRPMLWIACFQYCASSVTNP